MNQEKDEIFVRELMSKSHAKMPFDDFEEKLMFAIHKETKTARSIWKDVRLSWFFFIVGTGFGLLLSTISGELNQTIFGRHAHSVMLYFQVIFVVFLLLQLDKLVRLTRKNASKLKHN